MTAVIPVPTVDRIDQQIALWNRVLDALGDEMTPCVLHNFRDQRELVSTDVDCAIPSRFLPEEAARKLERAGLTLVQHIWYEVTAHCFVVMNRNGDEPPVFLRLDLTSDFRYASDRRFSGRYFFSEDEILGSARAFGRHRVPAPDIEFGCYLVKRVMKKLITVEHGRRLSDVFREDPQSCRTMLARFWNADEAERIALAADTGDWTDVSETVSELRQSLLKRTAARSPLGVVRHWLGDLPRLLSRWRRPAGLHVVILGPDGSGKSTVAQLVAETVAPAFNGTAIHHLRPPLPWSKSGSGSPVTDPHGREPHSRPISIAQAGYWLVRYVVGYALQIRPEKARAHLQIYDRYFLDILVDPRRYRHNGPEWLVRVFGRIVPKPDMVILLDAPTDILQGRKQEVAAAETERQRSAYLTLVKSLPNGRIINAAQPVEQVAAEASDALLDLTRSRTLQRLRLGEP